MPLVYQDSSKIPSSIYIIILQLLETCWRRQDGFYCTKNGNRFKKIFFYLLIIYKIIDVKKPNFVINNSIQFCIYSSHFSLRYHIMRNKYHFPLHPLTDVSIVQLFYILISFRFNKIKFTKSKIRQFQINRYEYRNFQFSACLLLLINLK